MHAHKFTGRLGFFWCRVWGSAGLDCEARIGNFDCNTMHFDTQKFKVETRGVGWLILWVGWLVGLLSKVAKFYQSPN